MRRYRKPRLACFGVFALISACGVKPAPPQSAETPSATVTATQVPSPSLASLTGPGIAGNPPGSFRKCVACHTTGRDGPNGIGPNLWGIVGRAAARTPGYRFSDALLGAGLIWDDATLDRWLTDPRALVSGNKMTYRGEPDPVKRAEIIAYLKTLR